MNRLDDFFQKKKRTYIAAIHKSMQDVLRSGLRNYISGDFSSLLLKGFVEKEENRKEYLMKDNKWLRTYQK